MKKPMIELICVGCGNIEEREKYYSAPKCFDCKKMSRRKYALAWSRKLKESNKTI